MSYMEIVKGLKSESTLHVGRDLLLKSWRGDYVDEIYIKELLDYVRLSMREMVRLEKPMLFDEDGEESLTEPETPSMF